MTPGCKHIHADALWNKWMPLSSLIYLQCMREVVENSSLDVFVFLLICEGSLVIDQIA